MENNLMCATSCMCEGCTNKPEESTDTDEGSSSAEESDPDNEEVESDVDQY